YFTTLRRSVGRLQFPSIPFVRSSLCQRPAIVATSRNAVYFSRHQILGSRLPRTATCDGRFQGSPFGRGAESSRPDILSRSLQQSAHLHQRSPATTRTR